MNGVQEPDEVAEQVSHLMKIDYRIQYHVWTQLELLQKLTAADDAAVLVRLAGQMFSGYDPADPGVPAIAAIANAVGEVERQRPGTDLHAAWTQQDFASVLGNVAAFLREEQRGLPRFIAIVKGRTP